jgi:hypothetical protein
LWSPAQTHEPIIDLPTWERAQDKLAMRKKDRQPRLGCYALSGLVRCGHCQANMIARVNTVNRTNGKQHVYRRVLCGTYNRTGGPTRRYNAVDADALVRAVVKKLREKLFNPESLAALAEEVRRQDEEAASGGVNPAILQGRLTALDRQLERAARRVVEEEVDALVPALRKQLLAIQEERDGVAAELASAQRQERPEADAEASVEEALAIMSRLEEAVTKEDNDLLRDVLGEAVAYVELFFTHARSRSGGRHKSTFARGLIYLRPQRWADYIGVNGSPAPCRNTTSG